MLESHILNAIENPRVHVFRILVGLMLYVLFPLKVIQCAIVPKGFQAILLAIKAVEVQNAFLMMIVHLN